MVDENGLYVNAPGMIDNGNETIESADEFLSCIQSLRSNVEGLMNIWRGDAATAFYNFFSEQEFVLSEFEQALAQRGENIIAAAGVLKAAEEENAAGAGRLRNES